MMINQPMAKNKLFYSSIHKYDWQVYEKLYFFKDIFEN